MIRPAKSAIKEVSDRAKLVAALIENASAIDVAKAIKGWNERRRYVKCLAALMRASNALAEALKCVPDDSDEALQLEPAFRALAAEARKADRVIAELKH